MEMFCASVWVADQGLLVAIGNRLGVAANIVTYTISPKLALSLSPFGALHLVGRRPTQRAPREAPRTYVFWNRGLG